MTPPQKKKKQINKYVGIVSIKVCSPQLFKMFIFGARLRFHVARRHPEWRGRRDVPRRHFERGEACPDGSDGFHTATGDNPLLA